MVSSSVLSGWPSGAGIAGAPSQIMGWPGSGSGPVTSGPFASSYAAVEQFNPQRYYSETGTVPGSLPTGTTGAPTTVAAPTPLPVYLWFVAIAVIIWALEKHKFRIFGQKK